MNLVHLDVDGDATDSAGCDAVSYSNAVGTDLKVTFVFGGAQDKEAFGGNFWAAGLLLVKDGQLDFNACT